jgi:hypothetical protein
MIAYFSRIRPWRIFIAMVLLMTLGLGTAIAAQAAQSKPAAVKKGKAAEISAPPKNDEAYAAKIREYTTEKFFLTELVDHLPASEKVPAPDKIIGYVVGTPNKLTYTKDIHRYMRELEKSSPRVRTFVMGQSEEGREMLLVAISDDATVANFDRYREITGKLADPRTINDEAALKLIAEGKSIYWASGSIHSPETGSPEMLMELAYRLAVEESPFIQAIRKNSIVLITPVVEVDGHDKQVDVYNYRKANPDKPAPSLLYWGKYVAHDNNRDGMAMSLALSRNMMKSFTDWHPTVLHDLHESVPFLYTSTGTGPYNAWLDPIVINEWQELAYMEVQEMTKRGVPGVWTQGFYDGWAPNYMFYIANGHNSIGRFYETFGGSGADTSVRNIGVQSQRAWFRPNPPLPRVNWSIRNNINMQQSSILLAMRHVADNREKFLNNFYLKSRRSIAKATNEGPSAWVIPGDDPRPVEAAELVNLLKLQGCEVHRSDGPIEVKEGKYPAGSYVVRMDQPYSRMADMLLDTQYFNVDEPRPYDDTGWTLGPLKNVKTARIMDTAILKAPMTLIPGEAKVRGQMIAAPVAVAYAINHNTDNTLMTLRYRLKDVRVQAAEEAFKIGDRSFNAGSFIIPLAGAPADLGGRLGKEAADLGITAVAVSEVPKVAVHDISAPRIALLHTWQSTQTEGWFRIAFDRLQVPYAYISVHVIRDTPNLKDLYDVILFSPATGTPQSLVRGLPKRTPDPIPWKKTELTPNLGSEDSSDDIRGGIELTGIVNLQRFIESGGLFITVGSNSALPIDYGLVESISIVPSQQLQARGGIYNAAFADRKSPIAYGYGEKLAVYFSQAPLFQVQTGFGGGGGGGGGTGRGGDASQRPTGRGSLSDPDVPQGRPLNMGLPAEVLSPGEEQIPDQAREQARFTQLPANMRPRIVLRFAPEKELWVSGMLAGAQELAGKPAVVDLPVGKGHVVMFANNPMWRQETNGSFFLVFNAALHYDHLGAGRSAPPARGTPGEEDEEEIIIH